MNLSTVEKKVLGALLILSDNDMNANVTMKEIADVMGYKAVGGAITFAIRSLSMKNYIDWEKVGNLNKFTVLL